jgi:hypothetical protein
MINFKEYSSADTAIKYHLDNDIPLSECIYRVGSRSYFEFYRRARDMMTEGVLQISALDKQLLEETDIGKFGIYEDSPVPLDCPMELISEEESDEKNPPLGKPKRGGPKKYYVYVKNEKGNVVRVTWGDTSGLSTKINDPEARKSFAARHQCSTQKDRTSAAYWACNTPRYAKQLGLSGGGSFYW